MSGQPGARSTPARSESGEVARTDARATGRVAKVARHRIPAKMSESQIDALTSALDALLVRNEPFAVVVEIDDEVGLTAPLRRKLAMGLEHRADGLRAHCVALAFIARTPTATGAHTAIRWLTPAVCPERVFIASLDAENWARTKLDATREAP